MSISLPSRRQFAASALSLGLLIALVPTGAGAHGSKVGDIAIDHPYATPTPPGARTGAVYFKALRNEGKQPDRLLKAETPIAEAVEFHSMRMEGDLMRMRAQPSIELAPGDELKLRHGGPLHLMLVGLRQPLKDGDRFTVQLSFEKAGRKDVNVWVQTPREAAAPEAPTHQH